LAKKVIQEIKNSEIENKAQGVKRGMLPSREFSDRMFLELARQPLSLKKEGGKSGLHRVKRQVIPGRREPTESATENKPPEVTWVRVKR
jgi:hypothetical protein